MEKRLEISEERLRKIVIEEFKAERERRKALKEAVDHKSINSVVTVASKLLAAVEVFKEKAPHAAVNATTPHLSELEKVLENMVSSPGSYVPTPKKEPQKVSLKAVKKEGLEPDPGLHGCWIDTDETFGESDLAEQGVPPCKGATQYHVAYGDLIAVVGGREAAWWDGKTWKPLNY